MGFYKPGANHTTDARMARLHKIIWVLIFGGLLIVILGIFVGKTDAALGCLTATAGGVLAVVGAVLVYVRSTLPPDA